MELTITHQAAMRSLGGTHLTATPGRVAIEQVVVVGACAFPRNTTTAARLRANAERPKTAKSNATEASARAETIYFIISKEIRADAAARLAWRGSAVCPGSA